jgi:outer membrane protein assembly factor BamB
MPPQHVTFVRGAVYVTSGDDGTVRVHDVRTGRARSSSTIPAGSYNVDHAGDLIVTPSLSQGTVCLLRRDGTVLRRVHVAPSSHDACIVVT